VGWVSKRIGSLSNRHSMREEADCSGVVNGDVIELGESGSILPRPKVKARWHRRQIRRLESEKASKAL